MRAPPVVLCILSRLCFTLASHGCSLCVKWTVRRPQCQRAHLPHLEFTPLVNVHRHLSLHHHFPLYKLSMVHFSSMLVKKKLKSGAFLNMSEVGEGPALLQLSVQAALLWVLYTRTGITTRMDSSTGDATRGSSAFSEQL